MDRLKLRCCCYCKAGGENGWQEEEETLQLQINNFSSSSQTVPNAIKTTVLGKAAAKKIFP
jgi:hypothetical protein